MNDFLQSSDRFAKDAELDGDCCCIRCNGDLTSSGTIILSRLLQRGCRNGGGHVLSCTVGLAANRCNGDEFFVLVEASCKQVDPKVEQAHDRHEEVVVVKMVLIKVRGSQPASSKFFGQGIDSHHETAILVKP